ncbi:MAG: hypothetical protein J3R72DRAFT_59313 [Linnemannia gamsii]|nr:MAG: hypothetical protein J3R72DRAFT_59313 [Linnemannia gamsii]
MKDSPNQSPRNDYIPLPEERRLFLEEKYKRRNLAPEALLIRPGLRKLHLATIVLAMGTAGYFTLFADFGDKETCFSPVRSRLQPSFPMSSHNCALLFFAFLGQIFSPSHISEYPAIQPTNPTSCLTYSCLALYLFSLKQPYNSSGGYTAVRWTTFGH